MRNKYLLAPLAALLLAAAPQLAQAQTGGVGIGTTTPDASAALDVSSATKGMLPPRLSQAQRDAIASPAAGLTIFNTSTNRLNTWNGTRWEATLSVTEQPVTNPVRTFTYTGGPQTYTVPEGVTRLSVDAAGAQGGRSGSGFSGGQGARVQATLVVVPGEVLTLYVGGAGVIAPAAPGGAGYNGGGNAGYSSGDRGGGGGGASDVRRSATAPSTALTERLLVAAGGGGACSGLNRSAGGAGGAPNGSNGGTGALGGTGNLAGTGATQTAGGNRGGGLGQGGDALSTTDGGGGGGGYYGGGGGDNNGGSSAGAGGGGSSWATPTGSSGIAMTAGYRAGDGFIVVAPAAAYAAPALDGSNFVNVPGDNLGNHTATQALNLGANLLVGNGGSTGLGVSSAGAVGIGTASPAASAALEVSSTTKGLLPPRLTQLQRDAIGSPATGLTLYNTDTNKFNTWNGTRWEAGLSATEQALVYPTITFAYTGAPQTYFVPEGVTRLGVEVLGAQGGSNGGARTGGQGARVQATLAVTPGETLTLYVGGAGTLAPITTQGGVSSGGAGYNGGGNGGYDGFGNRGGGGGGASDVRRSATAPSTALTERLLVAAGGGGASSQSAGGAGGAPNGSDGGTGGGNLAGTGATQTAGGNQGGTLGQGGVGIFEGGGGGGGYYGGGGGSTYSARAAGAGGGGSSWGATTGISALTMTGSYRAGNGLIVLTPNPVLAAPVLDGSNITNVPGTYDNLGNHTATQNLNLATYQLTGNGGSAGLTVSSTGNVGIGTNSPPTTLLDVRTTDNSAAITVGSTGGGAGAVYLGNDNHGLKRNYSGGNDVGLYTTSGTLFLSANGPATFSQFALLNNGNLGIGRVNPSQKLDVNGNAVVSGNLGIGNLSPGQRLDVTGNATVSGNLGVGVAAPGQKLEVAGNAQLTVASGSVGLTIASTASGSLNLGLAGGAGQYSDIAQTGDAVLRTNGKRLLLSGREGGTVLISTGAAGAEAERLRVTTDGKVGIGTSGPTAALDVAGALVVRANSLISTQGAHLQWNRSGGVGETLLLNQQGLGAGGIVFGQSNAVSTGSNTVAEWARFDGNGRLGIGTSAPFAKLHVSGSATATPSNGSITFFTSANQQFLTHINNASGTKNVAAYFENGEVWVNGYIVAGSLQATSDRRIKNVVGLSDRATDLALLNRLRITDYTYIDQLNNTNQVVKKVIAQEVEEVLPAAVTRSHQALPDIFEKATKISFANGYLTVTTAKPHGLPAAGGRMRFYTPANQSLDPDVTVVDAYTVRFASAEAHAAGLFVYGKYVNDFRSVDYDALAMLNVSATQELARKVAALEAENTALKAHAAATDAKAAQATATLETFEARLRRLEAAGSQAQR